MVPLSMSTSAIIGDECKDIDDTLFLGCRYRSTLRQFSRQMLSLDLSPSLFVYLYLFLVFSLRSVSPTECCTERRHRMKA